MHVEIFIFNDDERNRVLDLALYAVLVGRRNEKLQPQVIRKRQELVAPRRVDSVKRLVEEDRRGLRRILVAASVVEELRE